MRRVITRPRDPPQKTIGKFLSDQPYVLVTIYCRGSGEKPELPTDRSNLMAVLELEFHESSPEEQQFEGSLGYGLDFPVFTYHHAHELLDFLTQWLPKVDLVVTSCQAGLTRSPQLAWTIARMIRAPAQRWWIIGRKSHIRRVTLDYARKTHWRAPRRKQ